MLSAGLLMLSAGALMLMLDVLLVLLDGLYYLLIDSHIDAGQLMVDLVQTHY